MTVEEFADVVMGMCRVNFKPSLNYVFKPSIHYVHEGDCIELFVKPDPFYGEYVNSHLTVYKSQETNEIVGVLISDMHKLMH
jgi:hypothetical protein